MPITFRRRLPWGVLLGLLVTAAIWAMGKIPYTDPMDYFDCTLSADGNTLVVGHSQFTSSPLDDQEWGWVTHFDLDLATGQIEPWTYEQSVRSLWVDPPDKKKMSGDLESFQYPTMRREILWARDQWNVDLVGGRYIIGHHAEEFRSADLQKGQTHRKKFDSPGSGGMVYAIPGSSSFVCTHDAPTPASVKTPVSSSRVDLIKINAAGDLEFVADWTTVPGAQPRLWTRCSIVDGRIATLNSAGTAIEYRDVADGRNLETLALPASIDANKQIWNFWGGMFYVDVSATERLYIDLRSKSQLPAPPRPYELLNVDSIGTRLLNYRETRQHRGLLIDRESGEHVMRYSYRKHFPLVLDEKRLLSPSHAFGFSADIVEIPSGRYLYSVVPLWWVPWFLVASIVTYLMASIGWIRASVADRGWAWLDVVVIGGIPLLLFSMRLLIGPTHEYYRSSNHYINGICIAALALPVIWLVLGRTRLSLRVLPLLLTCSFLIAARYMVLGERPVVVWHRLYTVLLPVAYVMPICVAMRLFGLGFVQESANGSEIRREDQANTKAKTLPLRDLMLLVACIAALFASLAPLLTTITAFGQAAQFEWRTDKAIGVMMMLFAATLAPSRWLFVPACVFAGGMLSVLTTYELSRFITDSDFGWLWNYRLLTLSIYLSASIVAIFVFLLPYRLRGWRIGRPRYANKSLTT